MLEKLDNIGFGMMKDLLECEERSQTLPFVAKPGDLCDCWSMR